jgi:dipeptidyl aminopeptidase/acylaminoacyl peptidase
MVTGVTRCLTDRTSKDGWAAAPRWSPGGRWLAFFTTRGGRRLLTLWDRERDHHEVPLDLPTPGLPMSVSWNESGSSVFVVTEANESQEQAPPQRDVAPTSPVTVWRSAAAKYADADGRLPSKTETTSFYNDGLVLENITLTKPAAHDVWEVSVQQDRPLKARRVIRGNGIDEIATSPDGRWLAVLGNLRRQAKTGARINTVVDLYLLQLSRSSTAAFADTQEGERNTVWRIGARTLSPAVTGIPRDGSRDGLSWSPDSKAVAYISNGTFGSGDVFAVALPPASGGAPPRNLSEHAPLERSPDFVDTDDYEPYKRFGLGSRRPCAAPLWTVDGKAIVRAARGDVWYLPARETAAPRKLTAHKQQYFTNVLAWVNPGGIRQAAGDERSMLVHSIDRVTLREALWRLRLSDGNLTLVVSDAKSFDIARGYGDLDDSTERIVTGMSALTEPQELWTIAATNSTSRERLTVLNPPDRAWLDTLSRRDVQWSTPYGQIGRGVLILPPSSGNAARPPVIVTGYPGSAHASKYLHAFMLGQTYAPTALLSRGYAVFVIDVPFLERGSYGTDGPMKAMVKVVEGAVDALIGTRAIDRTRIVVYGYSQGGQMVNTLLTQSRRFAGGIAGAGIGNLVSAAGSGAFGMAYFEHGQGRMEVPLWTNPQRYIDNSPVFYLDRVSVPLLLYHGTDDGQVAIEQSDEIFRGLARLSQDVTLLRYRGETHAFGPEAARDAWSRILTWLDQRFRADAGQTR